MNDQTRQLIFDVLDEAEADAKPSSLLELDPTGLLDGFDLLAAPGYLSRDDKLSAIAMWQEARLDAYKKVEEISMNEIVMQAPDTEAAEGKVMFNWVVFGDETPHKQVVIETKQLHSIELHFETGDARFKAGDQAYRITGPVGGETMPAEAVTAWGEMLKSWTRNR